MKTILILIATLLTLRTVAQPPLPAIMLSGQGTLHFVSPEPIQYVDIPGKALVGDLPLPNVCRIHLRDTAKNFRDAVISIAGETFMAQYRLISGATELPLTRIDILPEDTRPLDIAAVSLSTNQLKRLAQNLLAVHNKHAIRKAAAFGITASLNGIHTLNDYVFLDVSLRNSTNLKYDIEDLRWSIEDKKITKATNVQSIDVRPVLVLHPLKTFSHTYRNIIVIRKISYPGNKILRLTVSEKQISGRVVSLDVSYRDVLEADFLPPL